MSGYSSITEVRTVVRETLQSKGRDPKHYNIAGIIRDAFYYRGPGQGYGAFGMEQEWEAALIKHRRTNPTD